MRGGRDVVDGAVEGEEDGESRVSAVVEGELGVGQIEGAALERVGVLDGF